MLKNKIEKGKPVWIDCADELRDLVECEENASLNQVLKQIIKEFKLMSDCLSLISTDEYKIHPNIEYVPNNFLESLHPEWKYDIALRRELNFDFELNVKPKLEKIFEKKKE